MPKRITILGDDEKEYKFLVKGGEDLRLDQRIEQVMEDNQAVWLCPTCGHAAGERRATELYTPLYITYDI